MNQSKEDKGKILLDMILSLEHASIISFYSQQIYNISILSNSSEG